MTKIRENLSTFFSIFAGIFVVYIVLDWGMDITGQKRARSMAESQEIGRIDDKPILAKDFTEMVRRANENQKTQSDAELDENQQRAIRDQIWNQLVEQALYDKEIERLGIKVTDQEIIDWVRGDNPPDFLKQQFIDSTGTFNRQAYDAVIMDPRNKTIMVQVEDALRKQRLREKLHSIITASVHVSASEMIQKFSDQNIKYEADYAFFDPNVLVKDEEVNVSDDEIQRYFNEHSEEYKVEATRKLKYVRFDEVPSKDDTMNVIADIDDIMKRAKAGMEFDTLVKMYSEIPVDTSYISRGAIGTEKAASIFDANAGDLIGPIKDNEGYHLIKVISFRKGTQEFTHASHILVKIENNDSVQALQKAKEINTKARARQDFAELARQFSDDPGTGVKGGDLGWFERGRMVKEFDEAIKDALPGRIFGPVCSPSGYHIIKVHARDNREVKYSEIYLPIKVSGRTRGDIFQHAQDFAYLANEGSFEKEAEQSKYKILETTPFQKDATIPGLGVNKAISRFAFENKINTVSEPFSVQNGYAVVMISEVKEAGIRPLDEVKKVVENRLKRDKKIEKIKSIAQGLRQTLVPTDSLQKISKQSPSVNVQHLVPFTISGYIPGIGRDLNFVGTISSMQAGEISNPIESTRGVYIIKLISKSNFNNTAFEEQKESIRSQLLNEKKNRFFSEWSEYLKKSADIVDNRDLFYR